MKPVRRLLHCRKTFARALDDAKRHQELLKDFRRPFMHAVTVHDFCSEAKEPPWLLNEFVHECGDLNDKLRQDSLSGRKVEERADRLLELLEMDADEMTEFVPISRRQFLKRIKRRCGLLEERCHPSDRVFTPHQFHSLRYDLRQLMYIHKGAWKVLDGTVQGEAHFRVFLHLLQLSERMGELNDLLIDTRESNPVFLTAVDRQDLIAYLNVKLT